MTYLPPDPCGAGEFVQKFAYTPPDPCGGIEFIPGSTLLVIIPAPVSLPVSLSAGVINGGQEVNLPISLGTGTKRFVWGPTDETVNRSIDFPFAIAEEIHRQVRGPFTDMDLVAKSSAIAYAVTTTADITRRGLWGLLTPEDIQRSLPYINFLPWVDLTYHAPYVQLDIKDAETDLVFLSPQPVDAHAVSHWDKVARRDIHMRNPYGPGEIADRHLRNVWGPYWWSLLCEQLYFPPGPCGVAKFTMDDPMLGGCVPGLELYSGYKPNIRCPIRNKTGGIRDKYIVFTIPPIPVPPAPQLLKVFYMQNAAEIRVLPLDDPPVVVEFLDVTAQIDTDSWLWDFRITVPKKDYVDLVKPQGSNFVSVEIEVNGHKWSCMIEGWRESRTFGYGAWELYGRSPSAVLGAPYCLPQNFTNDAARQGRQIMDDVLQYSGYSVDWTPTAWLNPVTDWLVPANIFSYSQATLIDALKVIAGSVGAYLQTYQDPVTDPKLIVLPRYPDQPWFWVSKLPDRAVSDNMAWEIGRRYVSRPIINSVIASGTSAGVAVRLTRQGTAGDLAGAMLIEDLITTAAAGTERARMELHRSGDWVEHTLRLFSLYPSGTEPGLVLPGHFLSVEESGQTWKGQVIGTAINAGMNNGVLQVSQTLEVEEYIHD